MHMIRPERAADFAAIDLVHTEAFGRPQEAALVRALRDADSYERRLSLVACEIEQAMVPFGHILYTPATIIDEAGSTEHPVLALAPLAVRPSRQRQGVGTSLVKAGFDHCEPFKDQYPLIVVLGDPEYYGRLGFRDAREFGILPPFEVPPGALMVQDLVDGASAGISGVLQYPPAFDGVD